jgi:hypothetical protein
VGQFLGNLRFDLIDQFGRNIATAAVTLEQFFDGHV